MNECYNEIITKHNKDKIQYSFVLQDYPING